MKQLLSFLICMIAINSFAQESIGVFQFNKDIGSPKLAGSASYDKVTQTYTIKGAGYNIWGQRDEHHYLYNKLKGDFIVTANFEWVGFNEAHRKIGWMARATEADNSVMVGGFLHGDGLTAGQWRERRGADMQNPYDDVWATKKYFQIIQLERLVKNLSYVLPTLANPSKLSAKKCWNLCLMKF